jgi:hypothetical protein
MEDLIMPEIEVIVDTNLVQEDVSTNQKKIRNSKT